MGATPTSTLSCRIMNWRCDSWDKELHQCAVSAEHPLPPPVHVYPAERITVRRSSNGLVIAPSEPSSSHPVVIHLSDENVRTICQAAYANRTAHILPPPMEQSAAFHYPQATAEVIRKAVITGQRPRADSANDSNQSVHTSTHHLPHSANSNEGHTLTAPKPVFRVVEPAERVDKSAKPILIDLSREE